MKSYLTFWNNQKTRGIFYQLLLFGLIIYGGWQIYDNVSANLAKAKIASGYDFLSNEASFDLSESMIEYSAKDQYWKALTAAGLNTLKVSVIGILFSVIIGTLIGIFRLSKNPLASGLSYFYTEGVRNTPLLLKLFYCYALITEFLPSPKEAINPIYGVYMSNRGIKYPRLESHWVWDYAWLMFILGLAAAFVIRRVCLKHQEKTGKIIPYEFYFILLPLAFPLILWLSGGMPYDYKIPELQDFNFVHGNSVSPEFLALLAGLVIHTSAYIAEVIRAGIVSVSKGQSEAAFALGLRPKFVMYLVIMPQAFRVIIPPLTNQMLNLTKNSSLAVAIGYPDFVAVTNTTINQTGQAIEGIMMIMAFYLVFSLSTSLFMNWFNNKASLVER